MRGGYPIGRRQPLLGGGSTASKQGSAPPFRVTPTQPPENDRSNDVDPLGKCHPSGNRHTTAASPLRGAADSPGERRRVVGKPPLQRVTATQPAHFGRKPHRTGLLHQPPGPPPPTRATPPPSPCPVTHPTQTLAPRKPSPHHTPAPPHNRPTPPHSDNSHSRATNFTSQVIISELFFPSRHPRVKHPGVGRFAG